MKIAILLSGLPRMWRPSIATQLAMFPGHQVDVFFHFWDTIDVAEKEAIVALTRPKAYQFQAPQDFSAWDKNPDVKPDNINVPSRSVSQYYSWNQVATLFAPYVQDYDVALRCRADTQFVSSVEEAFPHLQKCNLVVPWWEEGRFLSDIFALGRPDTILYYHTLYGRLLEYAKQTVFNSELLLQQHLFSSPTRLLVYPDKPRWYFVRRPHMEEYTIEQCMAENPGRNKWMDPEILGAHRTYHTQKDGQAGAKRVLEFYAYQLGQLLKERREGPPAKD